MTVEIRKILLTTLCSNMHKAMVMRLPKKIKIKYCINLKFFFSFTKQNKKILVNGNNICIYIHNQYKIHVLLQVE